MGAAAALVAAAPVWRVPGRATTPRRVPGRATTPRRVPGRAAAARVPRRRAVGAAAPRVDAPAGRAATSRLAGRVRGAAAGLAWAAR